MKQFIGLVLAVSGAAVTLWGGYHMMTGNGSVRVELARDFFVTTMTAGLFGVLMLTLGLLWVRE